MTATQAGQPAQDPEDGHDASRTAADADGTVMFDPGYAGDDRLDDASLTAGSEATGRRGRPSGSPSCAPG